MCNPATGERRVLPSHDVSDDTRVLLDVDPLVPSFKLLVAKISRTGRSSPLPIPVPAQVARGALLWPDT